MEQIEHRNTARRAMTGTSWKMNLVPSAADAYLRELVPLVAGLTGPELFVLPAFPSIAVARDRLLGTGIAWGAQDVHPDEAGAHTGDVSAPMLADLGCRFVEVGHAERRRDHGETPALVAAKVRSIIRWGMEPIVCVGDAARTTPAEAIAGILADLALVVDGLDATGLARLVVAYEPVWAIGQGAAAAPPEVVGEVHAGIRGWLDAQGAAGQAARVIYGGSVDEHNAPELLRLPAVDGVFVGRRALDPAGFAAVAAAAASVRGSQAGADGPGG